MQNRCRYVFDSSENTCFVFVLDGCSAGPRTSSAHQRLYVCHRSRLSGSFDQFLFIHQVIVIIQRKYYFWTQYNRNAICIFSDIVRLTENLSKPKEIWYLNVHPVGMYVGFKLSNRFFFFWNCPRIPVDHFSWNRIVIDLFISTTGKGQFSLRSWLGTTVHLVIIIGHTVQLSLSNTW